MKGRFFLLALFLSVGPPIPAQTPRIDSLKNELSKPYPDSILVKILDQLSFDFSNVDPKRGLAYAKKGEAIALRHNWEKWKGSMYADYGVNYAALCNYKEAVDYNLRAVEVYKKEDNKHGQASVLANISLLYLDQSVYDKALSYDLEALDLLEQIHDIPTMAVVQENIGTIFLRQKLFSKTLYYYSLAYVNYYHVNDHNGMARNTGNKGIVYNEMGLYQKALNFHQEALAINKKYDDKSAMQINLANIGITYGYLNKYEQAVNYHLEAYEISHALNDSRSDAVNLGNAGEACFRLAEKIKNGESAACLEQARVFLQRAIDICDKINFKGPMAEFTGTLSEVYAAKGDYRKALEIHKDHVGINNSIQTEETKVSMAALEAKREIEIKDRDIVLKKQEIEISKLEAINKQHMRIFYMAGNILLVVVAFVLYKKLRARSLGHRKVLSEIAATQSHEVRGPLARILGLASLFDPKNGNADSNEEIIRHIQASALELDTVIKKVVNKTYETEKLPVKIFPWSFWRSQILKRKKRSG